MAEYTPQLQGWLFTSEGGYVDHPADPGGATNHGITRKVLARWRGVSPWTALPLGVVVTGDDLPNAFPYFIAIKRLHNARVTAGTAPPVLAG